MSPGSDAIHARAEVCADSGLSVLSEPSGRAYPWRSALHSFQSHAGNQEFRKESWGLAFTSISRVSASTAACKGKMLVNSFALGLVYHFGTNSADVCSLLYMTIHKNWGTEWVVNPCIITYDEIKDTLVEFTFSLYKTILILLWLNKDVYLLEAYSSMKQEYGHLFRQIPFCPLFSHIEPFKIILQHFWRNYQLFAVWVCSLFHFVSCEKLYWFGPNF